MNVFRMWKERLVNTIILIIIAPLQWSVPLKNGVQGCESVGGIGTNRLDILAEAEAELEFTASAYLVGCPPSISDMFLLIIENGEMIDGMVGNECGDGDIPRKYTADYTNAKSLLLQASSTTGLTNQSSFIFGSDDDGKTYSIMYILVGPFLFVSRRKLVRSLDANRGACPGDATARYCRRSGKFITSTEI